MSNKTDKKKMSVNQKEADRETGLLLKIDIPSPINYHPSTITHHPSPINYNPEPIILDFKEAPRRLMAKCT
ncbi:MAG: hypothetical protein NC201_00645 [Prevotella sp.]|nr:hypothetical protein [Bacteroides sp.]MCM1365736.1 hypothetical protein [Prevotella sp.]MCM1436406.1 hypothetical protein [Prevotella sp.]